MPVTRSQAISSKPRSETLAASPPPSSPAALLPSTTARTHPPMPPPATPSSFLGSGSEIVPSGGVPPCRRSLRLAYMSVAPTGSATSDAAESSVKRRRRSRASSTAGEAEGGDIGCKTCVHRGRNEVLEVRSVAEDAVGGKYMFLRSGAKIFRKGLGQTLLETDKVTVEKLVTDVQCVEEAFEKDKNVDADVVAERLEENTEEERFGSKEKGKGILRVPEPIELQFMKVNLTERKGKDKLVMEEDYFPVYASEFGMDADMINLKDAVEYSQKDDVSVKKRKPQKGKGRIDSRKESDRTRAMELAPKFAFFKPKEDGSLEEEEGHQEIEDLSPDADHDDWPGPFSTAMRIIKERCEKLRARESNSYVKKDETSQLKIPWMPSNNCKPFARPPPTLRDLCMKVLSDNAEEIESFDGIPDVLKHKLILMLCHSRKMSPRLIGLLVRGSPTEICLSDCSWATENLFQEVFSQCNTKCLKVVQLDLCGRCLPDSVLRGTLAQYPHSLPSLTTICLKGAYRLSDDGLNAIIHSAPSLRSVNLSQCSLLTSLGIINVAAKLDTVLTELYVDDCQNVDAMAILPALKKIIHLEVLSVAGIQSVCDKFVHQLIPVCGSHMKELIFARCQKLSSASVKTISAYCSRLCAIDLRNLNRLNDSAIGYLANGCRSLQKLKLRRSAFSDEAVAAFLEASGGSLIELSLNNVEKVAQQTALAISRQCSSTLYSLDLSFCRKLTDEALGLIVDSCSSLRILKLFGCTQATEVFFSGHSNSIVKLIGCKGQLLDEMEIPHFV
ncbi:unnamed protein product [Musa acuminata subsp. malaccensis]|uniref:(wild Malaysian banana) hypothetical protein n=1 Tax=Musa acuminata subsp. malaccensis TaxID=214687 RepID=A0A804IW04_MUSAM|nr:PREDICTED: uncharacterized protein LOC103982797 isoform X1 [Musa acuminata subsp. malaccensis]CAG1843932.1 unnamed protein product [Musa acuminata subsp. malaccensis]